MKKAIVLLLVLYPILLLGYVAVSGDVSGHWTAQTYYATGNISIPDDATLIIDSGATVKFAPNTGLTVYGTLDVNGISTSHTVFTSIKDDSHGGDTNGDGNATSPAPGDWNEIYLFGTNDNDGIGEFDYCRIRYAGAGNNDANVYFKDSDSGYFNNSVCEYSSERGLRTDDCVISVSGSSFDNNGNDGIYSSLGEIQIDNCQFNNNGDYAAYLHAVNIKNYSNNTGSGNYVQAFGISGTVAENLTLGESEIGFPIVVIGQLNVNDEITLTIPTGEVIKATSNGSLLISGTLDVNGTEANPVIFTSFKDDSYGGDTNGDGTTTSPAPGDWNEIYLYGTNDSDGIGEFDYCRIRYAGAGNNDANVYFKDSDSGYFNNSISEYGSRMGLRTSQSVISVSGSSFDNNGDHGVYTIGGEIQINNCQFNNNGNYAAYLQAVNIKNYTNNSGSGNFIQAFGIGGTVAENLTLSESAIGFPFVTIGYVTVNDNITLTIPAGEVVKATSDGRLSILGTLDVNGTEANPVIFTSFKDDSYGGDTNGDGSTTSPAPGDWNEIYLYGTNDNDGIGEFDYCRIRYAGAGNNDANVYFKDSDSGYFNNSISEYGSRMGLRTSQSVISVSGSSFNNNGDHGIYTLGEEIQINNCQFNNNGNYAANLNAVNIKNYTNNSGSGNFIQAFGISGTIAENLTLSESVIGFPFVTIGFVTVNDNITLTIPAGEVVKATSNGRLSILGTLDVNGTEANPVIFTSFKDDSYGGDTNGDGTTTSPAPGDWNEIYLYGTNDNDGIGEFDYCRIRYAGAGNNDTNISFKGSDSGFFNNSISEYSSERGLRTDDCVISVSGSSFDNNGDHGIYTIGGEIQINNCQFNNNGNYAANLNAVNIKNYTNNSGSGNFIQAFGIGGTIAENLTLGESVIGFPIVVINQVTVNDNITLTIPAGEVVKATSNGSLFILGTLDVNGTEANPVIFTSFKDDEYGGDTNGDGTTTSPAPGDWNEVLLYGPNDNDGIGEFDYCRIRYAGAGNNDTNIYFIHSDSGYFNNSVSEYSSVYGVNINDSDPTFQGSTFENNTSYGIYISGSSNPDFGTNSRSLGLNEFINNDSGNIQFYNATTNNISAYHNEWGYYDAASIDAHIYDDDENGSYGEVLFDPWFVENVEMTLMTANPLDFGMLYYGLDETLPVVIQNDGTVDLIVSDVSIGSRTDVFEFVYDNLNVPIAPGVKDTFFVTFTPDAEQIYESTLSITNNSSNLPLLEVALQGAGEYDEIPAPQNVTIVLSNGDATISWDAVTETVHGIPVTPDFYVINYSETVEEDPEAYYHLVMTDQTSFVHIGVNYFASQMFYQVIAIRDYEGQYTSRVNSDNEENRKITWGEYKKLIGIK